MKKKLRVSRTHRISDSAASRENTQKAGKNNLSNIDYKAKKYGESSYLIVLENLQPGEYGIVIGDPDNENTKNRMKVTTFSVE